MKQRRDGASRSSVGLGWGRGGTASARGSHGVELAPSQDGVEAVRAAQACGWSSAEAGRGQSSVRIGRGRGDVALGDPRDAGGAPGWGGVRAALAAIAAPGGAGRSSTRGRRRP